MCMIDGADYNDDGFTNVNMRKAAKEHFCDECRRTILRGERYEDTTQLYESKFYNYKTCEHCTAARSWLSVTCGGWLYYGVLEDLKQHWDEEWELKSLYLGRAVVGMRNGWRSNVTGELMKVPRKWTKYDLPFKLRDSYDRRTTVLATTFKTDDGVQHFTDHSYMMDKQYEEAL